MKNMKNRIIVVISLFAGLFLLNSCLKDTADYWPDQVAGKMYATIVKPNFQAFTIAAVPTDQIINVMVNIATDAVPTVENTFTVAFDAAAMNAYNVKMQAADTSIHWKYSLYPTMSIVDPNVKIAAGARTATFQVKLTGADKIDVTSKLMVPVTITSATNGIIIAQNVKTALIAVPIANEWEADYAVIGYRIRPGNPTEMISPNTTEHFYTQSPTIVQKTGFGNYSSYDIRIEITKTVMVVEGVNCYKVNAIPVDPLTGNSVGGMWTSWHGDVASKPGPPSNPTDINYYNPITQQFYLNCYYTSGAGNRIMWEICTRL